MWSWESVLKFRRGMVGLTSRDIDDRDLVPEGINTAVSKFVQYLWFV